MDQVPVEQIVSVLTQATREVFSTMLGIEITTGCFRQEPVTELQANGVVALVGVSGTWTGTGHISCSADLACTLAGAMLMTKFDRVNEEVLDAVAELANIIIGNVKTTFEDCLGTLALGLPTVILGRNYQTRCPGGRRWTIVPVHCGNEVLEVCFFLAETQRIGLSGGRAEVVIA